MPVLVVATRSAHKLREIRDILGELPGWEILDLDAAGVPQDPAEDDIEVFESFEENALAKSRFFAARTGHPTLADDSGICVDALDGAPGVRSKRFSGRVDLAGSELDHANNHLLLTRLQGVPPERRTGRFVCAAALTAPGRQERVVRGSCEGVVADEPRGSGGFGYDPLFFLPAEGVTMAELPAERKDQISHRARAMLAVRELLLAWPDGLDA